MHLVPVRALAFFYAELINCQSTAKHKQFTKYFKKALTTMAAKHFLIRRDRLKCPHQAALRPVRTGPRVTDDAHSTQPMAAPSYMETMLQFAFVITISIEPDTGEFSQQRPARIHALKGNLVIYTCNALRRIVQ